MQINRIILESYGSDYLVKVKLKNLEKLPESQTRIEQVKGHVMAVETLTDNFGQMPFVLLPGLNPE